MNDTPKRSWLNAITDAAEEQGVALPAFAPRGMGAVQSAAVGGRFATLKRRSVRDAQADVDGVEWTLWHTPGGSPEPVAAFRESRHPRDENVSTALALLKGWLVDGWSEQAARDAVGRHPMARPVEPPHEAAAQ